MAERQGHQSLNHQTIKGEIKCTLFSEEINPNLPKYDRIEIKGIFNYSGCGNTSSKNVLLRW